MSPPTKLTNNRDLDVSIVSIQGSGCDSCEMKHLDNMISRVMLHRVQWAKNGGNSSICGGLQYEHLSEFMRG
jgi:hypothetical protein